MKQIKINNITINDECELKEAQKLLSKAYCKYSFLVIIHILSLVSGFLLIGYTLLTKQIDINFIYIIFGISLFAISYITFYIYKNKLKPYHELVKIAKRNDQIRIEEKIRYKERQRLENLDTTNQTINEEQINHTLYE